MVTDQRLLMPGPTRARTSAGFHPQSPLLDFVRSRYEFPLPPYRSSSLREIAIAVNRE